MNLKLALLDSEKKIVSDFLKRFSLNYDNDLDYTLYFEENKEIYGTISSSKNIIKAFAVDPIFKGQLASLLITEIINHIYKSGYYFYQVYTKPEYIEMFEALNFYEIISSKNVALLESKNRNIVNILNELFIKEKLESDNTGCIVMNCNPFTLGHRFIISEAAKNHELLIVFILEEEKSYFKFKDRFEMVKRGVSDLKNVRVIPSSNYLISSLTFPTYFLKQDGFEVLEQALLDALIFEKYFIPIFKLKKRYLGSEEDLVTAKYNQVLNEQLHDFIKVIPRLKYQNTFISASIVRKAFLEKDFDLLAKYVPNTTYEYLINHYE